MENSLDFDRSLYCCMFSIFSSITGVVGGYFILIHGSSHSDKKTETKSQQITNMLFSPLCYQPNFPCHFPFSRPINMFVACF